MPIYRYQDPWTGEGDKGQKPRYTRPSGQSLEEVFKRIESSFFEFFSGGSGPNYRFIYLLICGVIVLWFASGLYVVNPEEKGVELLFGKYNQTSDAGLRYHLPYPIATVKKVKVSTVNREDIGVSLDRKGDGEGVMLTGDENIVNVNFEVQWRIKDAYAFLYKVKDDSPGFTVKSAAESAMRDAIGQNEIGFILRGEGRGKIALETKDLLQQILDKYEIGVEVLSIQMKKVDPPEKVINAFRDVQSARADKEREINQAYSYVNDILPRARGDAQKILQEAEGYKVELINKAEGESKRFTEIYNEYKLSPDITRERLRLEVIEELYGKTDKIIMDGDIALPFLDLMKETK